MVDANIQAELYTVAKKITVNAGSTVKYEFMTVPSARSLTIRRILIHFPTGSNYTMLVSIYKGEEQVFPDQGTITGDNVLYAFETHLTFDGGSTVYVKVSNTDPTNAHSIVVVIEGILVG